MPTAQNHAQMVSMATVNSLVPVRIVQTVIKQMALAPANQASLALNAKMLVHLIHLVICVLECVTARTEQPVTVQMAAVCAQQVGVVMTAQCHVH
jgi:hypothetical protein